MSLNRRDFLKLMGGTAAVFAFPSVILQGCKRALEKASNRLPVIWVQGQSCSGCSVSLLNKFDPSIAKVITEFVSLNFHQTIMAGTGDVAVSVIEDAVEKKRKDFILVVEGSIPMKSDMYCTIGEVRGRRVGVREWVERLGANAKAVVAVGSCATYGGIPAALPRDGSGNPTGAIGTAELLKGKNVVNIPGCPPHPDWMVGTLVYVLLNNGQIPKLDEYNRPLLYYGTTVHELCDRLPDYKRNHFATHWGDEGCLYNLGCLGMDTGCDIPKRKWVGTFNSCTHCGGGCIGCTEPVFPDYGSRGLFKQLTASLEEINKLESRETIDAIMKLRNGGVING
jgi:hydrogenase small subunit